MNCGKGRWVTRTPTLASRFSARPNTSATTGSTPSITRVPGTASRIARSAIGSTGRGASPARMASTAAQHATLRASGPMLSSVVDSGSAPSRGTRRAVGL